MGHRLTRIYTRTGDQGSTALADGSRVPKDAPRVVALGDVDELNAVIAMVLACGPERAVTASLQRVQQELFDLGGELSLGRGTGIPAGAAARLEDEIDTFNRELAPLKEFILPGGGQAAASCHLARAVCRRAERSVVALARVESVSAPLRQYLNRLSDLLFVLCRVLAREAGQAEVLWDPNRGG
jgi:cob(I)alamin adenosyltransferase